MIKLITVEFHLATFSFRVMVMVVLPLTFVHFLKGHNFSCEKSPVSVNVACFESCSVYKLCMDYVAMQFELLLEFRCGNWNQSQRIYFKY